MMDAFDADVLIYAVAPGHPLGQRVRRLFASGPVVPDSPPDGIGSVLLLPELLSKPFRADAADELAALSELLSRLDLRPVDLATAKLSVSIGARYRLRASDAVHLATAVGAGADRFITNNRRDFPQVISEIAVVYPDAL